MSSKVLPFTAAKALKIATSQEDVREIPLGSNSQKYGRLLGYDRKPWCGIFAWWVFMQCGTDIRHRDWLNLPGVGVASVAQLAAAAHARGWWHTGYKGMRAGDLVVLDATPKDPKSRDHIRFVVSTGRGTTYRGIGGNEGNEVTAATHDAMREPVVGYIRPPYTAPPEPGAEHTVKAGETLYSISTRYYRDGTRWPELYRANRQKIGSTPSLIKPGMVLVIP